MKYFMVSDKPQQKRVVTGLDEAQFPRHPYAAEEASKTAPLFAQPPLSRDDASA